MAIKLEQIANQVFDALAHDYAGMPECDDGNRAYWANACSKACRSKIITDRLLYQYITSCLKGAGDANLCFLTGPNCSFVPEDCGFSVRRLGEELWVVGTPKDTRVEPGDAIVAINKSTPSAHLGYQVGNPTGSDVEERQDWSYLLACSSHFTVRKPDGTVRSLKTRSFPVELGSYAPCKFETLEDGTCVLTVTQLDSREAADLLADHAQTAAAASRIVFDLRGCRGGIESSAYPLLDWLFDQDTNLRDVLGPQTVLTNYSVDNCTRREAQIAQLRLLANQGGQDTGDTLGWLDENLRTVRENKGKGWVRETVMPEDLPIPAAPEGQKVLVLTDVTTADAAEWFANVALKSPRSTLVGRATRGNLDYSNPLAVAFENRFIFVYPMSKTLEASEGRAMRGVGIKPQVEVAFTPAECTEDVIMRTALAL